MFVEGKRTPHRPGLLWRRFARRLHAWDEQGNPQGVGASSMLHSIEDRAERSKASFLDKVDRKDAEYDTDAIYFELLRDIGRTLELRVIVDIIAGASAGGINGTMLARAREP